MNRSSTPAQRGDAVRSNQEWCAGLRGCDAQAQQVQEELRSYIRSGLGRAFGNRGGLDDASIEDCTQDAMIRIVTKLDGFRGDSRFTTWAMAIAIRGTYTWLRRQRWGGRSLSDLGLSSDEPGATAASPSSDPADPVSRGDLLSSLRDAIDRGLTPRQRAAVLGELAGMPSAVLAEQLQTNVNALYKLHHDARLRLRAALAERGFSENDVRSILQGASTR